MPVARATQDGIDLFAPTRLYGRPDDLRHFINIAHESGLGVILDVVYSHFGPEGNYLKAFSESYFTSRCQCEWGDAINFDGSDAQPVRDFFIANACYWIDEFHFDGFRLDATQQIFDASKPSILAEVAAAARRTAGQRHLLVVAENEPQRTELLEPVEQGGDGLDALRNDGFHHCLRVTLTGRKEACYSDYTGSPQEILSAARHGFLYQGQRSRWQGNSRGTPSLSIRHDCHQRGIDQRDAAYHQGTVWAWLIGPYIDAWPKLHPADKQTARGFLRAFEPQLSEAGVGTVSEVFDAESPYAPRGCIAQAWSVAEVLRCLAKTSS